MMCSTTNTIVTQLSSFAALLAPLFVFVLLSAFACGNTKLCGALGSASLRISGRRFRLKAKSPGRSDLQLVVVMVGGTLVGDVVVGGSVREMVFVVLPVIRIVVRVLDVMVVVRIDGILGPPPLLLFVVSPSVILCLMMLLLLMLLWRLL